MLLGEDKIVLRTPKYSRRMEKDYTVFGHFLVLILIILFYHILIDYKSLISLVFLWLAVIYLKADIDSKSYIVTLSREGVCIKSLFQEKKYKWEELKIKRYEAWKDRWNIKRGGEVRWKSTPKYKGCVYFSLTPPILKKTEESPFNFWGSHRFSCICVCFMEKGFKWNRSYYTPINDVDEAHFKEKMREWNIKIKDYDLS